MNLEWFVTDCDYESVLSEPATYIDQSMRETAVLVVPNQLPEVYLQDAQIGVRDVQIAVRVRESELKNVCKNATLILYGNRYCVDDFDRLNIAEWILYVAET